MEIQHDISLMPYTTLHIGGPAEYFVTVRAEDELVEAVQWAKANNKPITVLGDGSNVLIADEGVGGLVIKNEISGVTLEEKGSDVRVTVCAGVNWDEFVSDMCTRELWGLENLSATPGTVGATPIQNVGAYGVEVSELIQNVRVYDTNDMVFKDMQPDACAFAYRNSIFKREEGKQYVVTAVTYTLSKIPNPELAYKDLDAYFSGRTPTLMEIREAVTEIRKKKFPDWHAVGTAGSFFKNPVISAAQFEELHYRYPELPGFETSEGIKIPLGYVLDRILNLRGVQEENVGTYEGQALVLVNHGGATAREVDTFAERIEQKVFDVIGVTIEREVRSLS